MSAAHHQLHLRRISRSLAAAEGWTQWALPELRKLLRDKQAAILTDGRLRGDELQDARAEYRALSGFLKTLHDQALAAFTKALPGTADAGNVEDLMPDPAVRHAILNALSPAPDSHLSEPVAPVFPSPSLPVSASSSFSPFSGLPEPVKPPATPATPPPP